MNVNSASVMMRLLVERGLESEDEAGERLERGAVVPGDGGALAPVLTHGELLNEQLIEPHQHVALRTLARLPCRQA